jgi:hypothetical protein
VVVKVRGKWVYVGKEVTGEYCEGIPTGNGTVGELLRAGGGSGGAAKTIWRTNNLQDRVPYREPVRTSAQCFNENTAAVRDLGQELLAPLVGAVGFSLGAGQLLKEVGTRSLYESNIAFKGFFEVAGQRSHGMLQHAYAATFLPQTEGQLT